MHHTVPLPYARLIDDLWPQSFIAMRLRQNTCMLQVQQILEDNHRYYTQQLITDYCMHSLVDFLPSQSAIFSSIHGKKQMALPMHHQTHTTYHHLLTARTYHLLDPLYTQFRGTTCTAFSRRNGSVSQGRGCLQRPSKRPFARQASAEVDAGRQLRRPSRPTQEPAESPSQSPSSSYVPPRPRTRWREVVRGGGCLTWMTRGKPERTSFEINARGGGTL